MTSNKLGEARMKLLDGSIVTMLNIIIKQILIHSFSHKTPKYEGNNCWQLSYEPQIWKTVFCITQKKGILKSLLGIFEKRDFKNPVF